MDTPAFSPLTTLSPLEFKRKNLPDKAGCYLFKDLKGKILYIGKAKSLKKRVNSYWNPRNPSEDRFYAQKIQRLVSKISDVDVFIVENEMEAILLENELIKKHQPEFNVSLKDDKSFPWVQISNEPFPRIKIIRNPVRFGLNHKYIGPFVDSGDLKRLLRYIRKIFPYCTCKRSVKPDAKSRPCVNFQLKLCPAPCVGNISEKSYAENISNVEKLLNGDVDFVANILQNRMEAASNVLQYEEAAKLRDQLQALEMFTVNQSVFTYSWNKDDLPSVNNNSSNDPINERIHAPISHDLSNSHIQLKDLDIVAGNISKNRAGMIIIHVRQGKLISKTPYIVSIENKLTSKEKYLSEFIQQHYLRNNIPFPDEIILKESLPSAITLSIQKHAESQKKSILFRQPIEEDKTAGLFRIASKNIELLIRQKDEYDEYLTSQRQKQEDQNRIQQGLIELQKLLNLEDPPMIIEGFDMAHIQGSDYTGSMVCFIEGKPSKSHYRHYRVRSVKKPDDIAAMREIMGRRYRRALKEDDFPDLVVVDGGKGQLNMTHQLFKCLKIEHIPHIGLVKPEGRSEKFTPPKIILPESNHIITLPKESPALHIIQHLRDESHRFANKYHQKLRQKRQSKSELDNIPGIGPARKRKLLTFFGSVREIRKASLEELSSVVGKKIGLDILNYFNDLDSKRKNKKVEDNSKKNNEEIIEEKMKGTKEEIIEKKKKVVKKKIILHNRTSD
ncbi:excinuclease ABC subunit UvrC [Candidatus Harpocratesius sp.]